MASDSEMVVSGSPVEGSVADLAAALRSIERRIEADRPGSILLADCSDEALAAALVGAKATIALRAAPAATDPSSVNGRLIAQLVAAEI